MLALAFWPMGAAGAAPAGQTGMLTAAQIRAIDNLALAEVHAGTTPGVSIGVVKDGLLVYGRGFGFADLSKHVRAGAATEYYAGSIAKQFTAAAVLLLAQAKKLSLSDPVTKYVPELRVARGVTVAQLLTHTSGLPDYTAAPGVPHDPTKPVRLAALIAAVNRMKPAFAPGSQYRYNNFNYMIAGLIVQRVAGVPLSVYLQTHIFEPLVMTSTFLAGDQGIAPDVARGYTRSGGRFIRVKPWNASWLFGAGDLVTTVDDLAKWDIGLPLLLDVDSMREMWSGMGWIADERGGKRFFWHNGELAGYHAMNAVLPDQHIGVIVLSNADSLHSQTTISPERLASRILDVAAPLPPARFENVVMARAREWLGRLERDDIDRTQLTPQFSQYLTDQVVIRAGLRGLGPAVSMLPIESFRRSGDTVYVFDVTFRRSAMRYQFALTPDGKIDGLLLQP